MSLSGVQLKLVRNLDDANEFMSWLGERRPVLALDTETTGLNPYDPGSGIRLLQLGDAVTGWAIPYKEWYGLIHEALGKYDGPIATHNGGFEMRWLYRFADWQIPRHQFHDTMLMSHIIDPIGSAALKTLAKIHIDPRAGAGQDRLAEEFSEYGWDWATIPVAREAYWCYSALDAVLTARLYEKFMKQCGPGGPYQRAYDIEIATRYIVSKMEHRGARVDVEYSREKYDMLFSYARDIDAWARDFYGINIGSPAQLGRKCVELGGEITQTTPSGKPKVDKYQLQLFTFHENPELRQLAQMTLDYRKSTKFAESYFGHFINDSDSDGVLHADIRTLGARTSRMSIGSPALQQIPKKEPLVRNAFIPRDGNVLVMSDYNQIEMRIFAHLSNDPDLRQAFYDADATGGDFFVEIGKELYGDPSFTKSDPRRDPIKNVSYGLAYGAGLSKLAETAGVPESQIAPVYNGLLNRYPGIKRYMNEVIDQGRRRELDEGVGYVELDDGRRLACDPARAYTLVNYSIQGLAASLFKQGLIRLDLAGYSDHMILPVHDEIVLDIPEEEASDALNDVPKVLTCNDYSVELSADGSGPWGRWGSKYEKKKK